MKKEEVIKRYGEEAWEKRLEQRRAYYKEHPEEAKATDKKYREAHKGEERVRKKKYRKEHPEEAKAYDKKYREEHPEEVNAHNQEANRKGGSRYDKKLEYMRTGIPGEKCRIRVKHANQYKQYKAIIAPESQIHHEWVPDTSEYRGVALVEAEPHQYGIVDVIEILDGKITLLTEAEVKNGRKKGGK